MRFKKLEMTETLNDRRIRAEDGSIVFGQDAGCAMRNSAAFSSCRQYRYTLTRSWDRALPLIMFVGLNPSAADATKDDPTVRRCVGFARRWGFGGLVLTNLFAYRSTDPSVLRDVPDPVGPDNDDWIVRSCQGVDQVVVAWGAGGKLHERDRRVLAHIPEAYCLGTTRAGAPRHPLYLAADTRLRRYRRR